MSSKLPDWEINLTKTKIEAPVTLADHTVTISGKFGSFKIQKYPDDTSAPMSQVKTIPKGSYFLICSLKSDTGTME